MLKAIFLLILFILPSSLYAEFYFSWIDEKGVYNFSDNYEKVPLAYRNQVQRRVIEEVPETQPRMLSPTPQAIPQREVIERGETSNFQEEWRGRKEIQSEQQLKQAEEAYGAVNKDYLEESDTLIERRYGSHQQFKSTIIGMTILRQERDRYEVRLIEAKETLKRISNGFSAGSSAPKVGSLSSIKVERDIYGRDKAWWRQKVFGQREQLKKTVDNYEKAYEAYTQAIDKLDPSRFGGLSLTQYQMISSRLTVLKGEMAKYEAQVNEADESMRKLIREAEESRANLEWLEE